MGRFEDITGKRYGRLTVIERADSILEPNGKHRTVWRCICECGKEKIVAANKLKSGNTKSCGCYARDVNTTHGMSKTRLYKIWRKMKDRCYNPKHTHYEFYGGKGICICEEWKDDFEAFKDWAVMSGYSDYLTIERIDNDIGYNKENCKWATVKEQNNNKGDNVFYTYNGFKLTMAEWAERYGINYGTFCKRLYAGWSFKDAIETPVGSRRRKKIG